MSLTLGYVFCALATLVIIAGDYFIKLAADQGLTIGAPKVLLACALYAVSAALWFAAMHHITLAQMAVAAAIFTLLALTALGVTAFGESLTARDIFGITLAIGALILMSHRA